MSLEIRKVHKVFGGTQTFATHNAQSTKTPMTFSVFVPEHADGSLLPVVTYLSGLTCTEENVTAKGSFQRVAAELGLIVVAPDTSPRGLKLPGEHDSYDFGSGAGFYVDATQAPWAEHYLMQTYVSKELPDLIAANFPADPMRQSLCGHSMGGHGALVTALRNPDTYRSVSAFSPICHPSECAWGKKAFAGYFNDRSEGLAYDTVHLIRGGKPLPPTLIDQGTDDEFLGEQLRTADLQEAVEGTSLDVTIRMQSGYDHSYYFIATFIEDHLRFHHQNLTH